MQQKLKQMKEPISEVRFIASNHSWFGIHCKFDLRGSGNREKVFLEK